MFQSAQHRAHQTKSTPTYDPTARACDRPGAPDRDVRARVRAPPLPSPLPSLPAPPTPERMRIFCFSRGRLDLRVEGRPAQSRQAAGYLHTASQRTRARGPRSIRCARAARLTRWCRTIPTQKPQARSGYDLQLQIQVRNGTRLWDWVEFEYLQLNSAPLIFFNPFMCARRADNTDRAARCGTPNRPWQCQPMPPACCVWFRTRVCS